jgi:hypothetical protein
VGISTEEIARNKWILDTTQLLTKIASKLEEHRFFEHLVSHMNKFILEGVIKHFNEGKQVQFYIPPSLQKDWLSKVK